MKKSLIIATLLVGSSLFGENKLARIPMDTAVLSEENGGVLPAINAYSDGVGIVPVRNSGGLINNKPLNELVFKYGEQATNSGETLKNYVLNGQTDLTEKDLANQLGNVTNLPTTTIGATCNDNNAGTYNDFYIDRRGTCVGTPNTVVGATCNDNNAGTYNDVYTNTTGTCVGTPNTVVGATCNDNNAGTYNDVYTNTTGTCVGTGTFKTCLEIKTANPSSPNGNYTLDVDGTGPLAPRMFECDMISGGYTVFHGMVTGWDGFPGNNNSVVKARSPISGTELSYYIALANNSNEQVISLNGASESCCDTYSLRNWNNQNIFYGRGANNYIDYVVQINKNYANSIKDTVFATDGSVNQGNGLNFINDYVKFR